MALNHMPTYGCEHLTKDSLTKIEEFYRDSTKSSSKTSIDLDFVQYTCLSCPSTPATTGSFSNLDKHFSKTKHDLAFGLSGRSIYCGKCNDLVYEPSIAFKGNPGTHLFNVQINAGVGGNKKRKLSQPSEEDEAFLSQNTTARPCGREGVRGLFNLGETCYMNAVLQMMVHNQLLSSYFLGMGHPVHTCPVSKEPEPSVNAIASGNENKTNGKKNGAGGESDDSEDEHMNGTGEEKEEKEQKTCVACGMTELFSDSSLIDQTIPAHAVNLLFASWKNIPHMSGKSQQDAQEWFTIIVDKLHEAVTNPLVTAANSHSYSSNIVNGVVAGSTNTKDKDKTGKQQHHTKHCPCFFHKVFYGRFHSDITCETCHHITTTEEEYSSLSLDFKKQAKKKKKEAKERGGDIHATSSGSKSDAKPTKAQAAAAAAAAASAAASAPPPHLHECLKAYTAPEIMSADNYTCPSCKAPCTATKRLRIRKLPAILCVHVKRFGMKKVGGQITNQAEKYEGKLDFPLVLDMGAYTAVPRPANNGTGSNKKSVKAEKNEDEEILDAKSSDDSELERGKYIYDLDSVVVHQGEHAHTGHYFAFCRQGGKWFRFDDEIVSATTTEDVLRQEAYLLFYGLRDIS